MVFCDKNDVIQETREVHVKDTCFQGLEFGMDY